MTTENKMNDVERATAKARCFEDADFTNVFQAKTAWERGFDACWDIVHRKHVFWGAGEPDCPRDIKAANGELHTLRCKNCGKDGSKGLCMPLPKPARGENNDD